jgi:hypothetical protein
MLSRFASGLYHLVELSKRYQYRAPKLRRTRDRSVRALWGTEP